MNKRLVANLTSLRKDKFKNELEIYHLLGEIARDLIPIKSKPETIILSIQEFIKLNDGIIHE